MDLTSLTLPTLTALSSLVAIGIYALVARAHFAERGVLTFAGGGALHALGTLGLALFKDTAFTTPILMIGLLIMLAGIRRFFARPALLAWWPSLLGLSVLVSIGYLLQLLTATHALHIDCLIMLPLMLQISRETLSSDNDETWSLPRQLLLAAFVLHSALLLGLAFIPSDRATNLLLTSAILSNLLWPILWQSCLAHRFHTRLGKLARYDALTGALNRRGLEEAAIRELRRAQKHQQPFALVRVHLNSLKEINQRYGFAAGDMALRHSARIIRERIEQQTVGRFSGNDFLILYSNTSIQQLRKLALEIELAIATSHIEHGDISFQLSAVVTLTRAGVDGDHLETLFASCKSRPASSTPTPPTSAIPERSNS